jgi:LysM repeat protein
MSVATEFAPTVYIPERARPATRAAGSARRAVPVLTAEPIPAVIPAAVPAPAVRRHLALVPGDRGGTTLGEPVRGRTAWPVTNGRAVGRRFGDSSVDWPLTIAPPAPLRLTRRGVAVLLLVTIAVGVLLLAVARASGPGTAGTATSGSVPAAGTVMVQPGDTLWSIAQRVAPQRDPRQVVDRLQHLNRLRSVSLTPGQTLKVG